jgi:futalosine hydrolase
MRLLLVAATAGELHASWTEPLSRVSGKQLFSHRYGSLEVDVLIAGVGMTATAYSVCRAVAGRRYDLAVNAGIGGCFRRDIPLGEVVNVAEDVFAELGAEDGDTFLSVHSLGLLDENAFPFTGGALVNPSALVLPSLQRLRKCRGITVSKVLGNESSVRDVSARLSPDLESMEGAAFMYVCLQEKIPCYQLRAISNYVERRNKAAWNIPLAVESLNKCIFAVIEELQEDDLNDPKPGHVALP